MRADAVGIRNLQLRLGPGFPIDTLDGGLNEAREAAKDLQNRGFRVSALGFYRNMLAPQENLRIEESQRLKNVIRMAAEVFKVPVIGVFAGRDPELPIEENIPLFKDVWTPLARLAEDFRVRLAFENCTMFRGYPVRGINLSHTPEAYERIFEEVPSVALGMEFDPSHCIKQQIDPLEFIRAFPGRIYHFHIKDHERLLLEQQRHGCYDPRSSHDRLPGYGEVDFPPLFEELKKQGYTGPMTIEPAKDPEFTEEEEIREALVQGKALVEKQLATAGFELEE